MNRMLFPALAALLLLSGAGEATEPVAVPDFQREVQPILDHRCVACHACYDAPCQLSLGSDAGIRRGAINKKVYDPIRVRPAKPTRLFVDAHTEGEWRKRGFHSVLQPAAGTNDAGLLVRLLALKHQHPQPGMSPLPPVLDLSLNRAWQCPRPDQFERYAAKYPLAGMPYALPAIPAEEESVLLRWVNAGAPPGEPPALASPYSQRVADWEAFLNGESLQEQLMSRYLYEHLFHASLYFEDVVRADPVSRQFFRLVRSRTPPGQPVDVIATARPYEDPGTPKFWYRVDPQRGTVVAKSHLPYAWSAARLQRYRQLFLAPAARLDRLPSYTAAVASNPFVAFIDLPVQSRYRFLLDDAEFFIGGFIKGPVCRGQVALDVIDDRFWVAFVNPDHPLVERTAELLAKVSGELRLPSSAVGTPFGLLTWKKYSAMQEKYLKAKRSFLMETADDNVRPTLDLVWDGDQTNSNAALTVFRHFDSATVMRGFVGEPPKTAWVISYSLFERIHYLLVAGFDVFGNLGHQLDTRLYMDFLRMEGEFNFLAFLPIAERTKVRDYWYRDVSPSVREHVYGMSIYSPAETGIAFRTDDARTEFMGLLAGRLGKALDHSRDLPAGADATALARLQTLRGNAASLMPETAVVTLRDGGPEGSGKHSLYTLTRDTGHRNVTSLFGEEKRLLPAEDALTLVPGIVGAYPNAFFRVTRPELPAFVAQVEHLAAESDYHDLVERYGVSRSNADFWPQTDSVLKLYAEQEPLGWGVLDFSRLESR